MASMPICFAGVGRQEGQIPMMRRESYREAYARFAWEDVRAALGWSNDGKVCLATSIAERHVARDTPALICIGKEGTGRSVSYRELSDASSRFANVLQRYGVGPGDRVAGLMPRVPEALIAVVGTLKAGAIYVPMFTGFGPDAIQYRLNHSRARLLVTHHEVRGQVPAGGHLTILCVLGAGGSSWPVDLNFWETLDRECARFEPVCCDRDDIAALIYTSGSTGQPKGGAIAVNFLAAIWPYIV